MHTCVPVALAVADAVAVPVVVGDDDGVAASVDMPDARDDAERDREPLPLRDGEPLAETLAVARGDAECDCEPRAVADETLLALALLESDCVTELLALSEEENVALGDAPSLRVADTVDVASHDPAETVLVSDADGHAVSERSRSDGGVVSEAVARAERDGLPDVEREREGELVDERQREPVVEAVELGERAPEADGAVDVVGCDVARGDGEPVALNDGVQLTTAHVIFRTLWLKVSAM